MALKKIFKTWTMLLSALSDPWEFFKKALPHSETDVHQQNVSAITSSLYFSWHLPSCAFIITATAKQAENKVYTGGEGCSHVWCRAVKLTEGMRGGRGGRAITDDDSNQLYEENKGIKQMYKERNWGIKGPQTCFIKSMDTWLCFGLF